MATACLLVAAAGCGSTQQASVQVTPLASRGDDPVAIRVTGLPKDAVTQIGVTSTDAAGEAWASQASFTADAAGVVDVSTAASTGGSYTGVSPMGLITMMHTVADPTRLLAYRPPPTGPSTFSVRAQAPGVDQTTTITRTFFPHPVTRTTLTLARDHVVGVYVAPTKPVGAQPAVLILGGSGGGLSSVTLAESYAARGIPAMAVAYFNAPGLPKELTDVPLSYFTTAVRWIGAQPGVDPHRVWVSGASYGSEAALLLGARYPDLVHGVLSLSGDNTVTCSVLAGQTIQTCDQAPFTDQGKPIPFTRQVDNAAPTDVPAAVIPVEKISGPVLVLCGEQDVDWHACQLSQAVLDRRKQHGTGKDDLLLGYPDAGHYVNNLLANRPLNYVESKYNGSTPQADPDAWTDAWPKILARLTST